MARAPARVVLAANNADVGGGEVMLLATARVLRDLGLEVLVVGPTSPGGVLEQAGALGVDVHGFAPDRRAYLGALRAWAGEHTDWIWCHGLVPALATAGRSRRVVHLHQVPAPRHRAVARVARSRAAVTLVPSRAVLDRVPGAEILPNWTPELVPVPSRAADDPVLRIGFIGRLSVDKGLVELARAVADLDAAEPGRYRLVLAGDGRFVAPAQADPVTVALAEVEHLLERRGWVPPAELLGAVDLLAVPSQTPEAFGLVAAEAMGARVPCVVSDVGALPEVVGPGHPWVCAAGDAADLARVLRSCARTAGPQRAVVVEAAHERWRERFSPAAGAARVERLVRRLGIVPPAAS